MIDYHLCILEMKSIVWETRKENLVFIEKIYKKIYNNY